MIALIVLNAMDVPASLPKAAIEVLSIGLLALAIRRPRNSSQAVGVVVFVSIALMVFAELLSGRIYVVGWRVDHVPARGVSPQPGQAELHAIQRATADSRLG